MLSATADTYEGYIKLHMYARLHDSCIALPLPRRHRRRRPPGGAPAVMRRVVHSLFGLSRYTER